MLALKLDSVRTCFALFFVITHAIAASETDFLTDGGVSQRLRGLRQNAIEGGIEEDTLKELVGGEKPVAKLIGGTGTQPGEFSWVASLRFPDGVSVGGEDKSGQHFCGGSLIAENVVLTAGHCLLHRLLKKPVVHIGRWEREGEDKGRFETFQTAETRVHPNFKGRGGVYDFDVALLVLDGKSKVKPMGVRQDEKCFEENSLCAPGIAFGWGLTSAGDEGSAANILLKVNLPLLPRKQCGEKLGTTITNAMVCAGEPGKDACQLDSGGPLLVGKAVAGATSWGKGCGENPGVYANIGGLHEWIDKQLREIKGEVIEEVEQPKPPPKRKTGGCSFRFGRFFPPGCNRG